MYHAAAVFASNYLVAATGIAEQLLAAAGVPDPLDAIAPLQHATVANLARIGPAEARTRAMARFGSVTVAADQCRDARGTALLDSAVRDVVYACRSFRRAPLVALTIVTTVGLGLGLVAGGLPSSTQ